jgi:sortilin-related receptor
MDFFLLFFQQNALNDSHSQLMVHWLGEGSDVMICLARDPPLGPKEDAGSIMVSPSTGMKFENS